MIMMMPWTFTVSVAIGVAVACYLIGYKRGWNDAVIALYTGMKQWDEKQTARFAEFCKERIRQNTHKQ